MNSGNLRGSVDMKFGCGAMISALQQRTGRRIDANKLHANIYSWAMSSNLNEGSMVNEFKTALSNISHVQDEVLICFRGRRFEKNVKPLKHEMGPPPKKGRSLGRYNGLDDAVLYLCENFDAVLREVNLEDNPLWIQKYLIPTNTLRIGDFRTGDSNEFISQVFWFAEHSGEAPNMPPSSFSQFIAKLVSKKFDGMLVPGIRGDEEFRYCNIVILKYIEEWESWVDVKTEPRRASVLSDT